MVNIVEESYIWTLLELKTTLYLCSMIKPSNLQYWIRVKTLAEEMGVRGDSLYSEMRGLSDLLCSRPWFNSSTYENGMIFLELNPDYYPELIKLKEERPTFRIIQKFKSAYSITLYHLLQSLNDVEKITLSVDEIRRSMRLGEFYPLYGNFKEKVLNPCIKDLVANTDLKFTWKEKREGRKISLITFEKIKEEVELTSSIKSIEGIIPVKLEGYLTLK